MIRISLNETDCFEYDTAREAGDGVVRLIQKMDTMDVLTIELITKDDEDDTTYKIVRYYAPSQKRENETIATGLTLAEAQEHCQSEDTHVNGVYFDGYTEE